MRPTWEHEHICQTPAFTKVVKQHARHIHSAILAKSLRLSSCKLSSNALEISSVDLSARATAQLGHLQSAGLLLTRQLAFSLFTKRHHLMEPLQLRHPDGAKQGVPPRFHESWTHPPPNACNQPVSQLTVFQHIHQFQVVWQRGEDQVA